MEEAQEPFAFVLIVGKLYLLQVLHVLKPFALIVARLWKIR